MTPRQQHRESLLAEASLRFGSDDEPGIRRQGTKRFRYVVERTGRAPSAADLERVSALAIPPAWTDVRIAADPCSHLQATGRDARGRKQYRYHADFTATTSQDKFAELVGFGAGLGRLRRRVQRDLGSARLDHDHVVAVVVRLLDLTSLRVGNEEYAKSNRSFGLTTLRARHVSVDHATVHLGFVGKSHRRFEVDVDNKVLARAVRRCQHLPGQMLFQYQATDQSVRSITSNDVNRYLGEHCRAGATAKTFRTWNASVSAARRLAEDPGDGPSTRTLNAVLDEVAAELGNTRAVCRQSYVHPRVLQLYFDGTLPARWDRRPLAAGPTGLMVAERCTLRLLRADHR